MKKNSHHYCLELWYLRFNSALLTHLSTSQFAYIVFLAWLGWRADLSICWQVLGITKHRFYWSLSIIDHHWIYFLLYFWTVTVCRLKCDSSPDRDSVAPTSSSQSGRSQLLILFWFNYQSSEKRLILHAVSYGPIGQKSVRQRSQNIGPLDLSGTI